MKEEEYEIRDQPHLMFAEGKHDEKPDIEDIEATLEACGFRTRNLKVFFDDFQGLWNWNCDIVK